jgi:hypothetical protein
MSHSHEEIRAVALDILAGREKAEYEPTQYESLKLSIGEVLARRENRTQPGHHGARYPLDGPDSEIFLEVFWDLFRQGIITLGLNDSNRQFPFFGVSTLGKQIAESQSVYFFHDVSSYEQAIRSEVPNLNEVTLLYLKEAMQAFRTGCILSCTVMLGVATEHTFLLLLDTIEHNAKHNTTYAAVLDQRTILQKINKFKNLLEQHSKVLPDHIKEDLDTHFAGILSVIRTFRNQSGHPTGKVMDREQAFVLLQLFIPYSKKLYQLMDYFRTK